jgi:hypothetical protein
MTHKHQLLFRKKENWRSSIRLTHKQIDSLFYNGMVYIYIEIWGKVRELKLNRTGKPHYIQNNKYFQ